MTLPVRPAVLVIGASAGGVAALQAVLGALPAKLPVPVLAVLHLPRDRTSRIAEVLAPYCALPVREAEDKQPLQPGTVTFAPPDYHLLVEDEGALALSVDAPVLFSRPAIDPLFDSAAAVFGAQVLALLLTGASSDGSEGVAAVRRAGGHALAAMSRGSRGVDDARFRPAVRRRRCRAAP